MSEMPSSGQPSLPDIQSRLQEVTHLLRHSSNIDDDTRAMLAELVDELGAALRTAQVPGEQIDHLAGTTSHLVEALHHRKDTHGLTALRDRLEDVVAGAEANHPYVVGVARRLLDTLANMGI